MEAVEKKMEMSLDDIIKANRSSTQKPKARAPKLVGKAKAAAASASGAGGKGGNAPKVLVTKPGVAGKRQAIKLKKAGKAASTDAGGRAPVSLAAKGAGVTKGVKVGGGVKQSMAKRIMNKAKGVGAGSAKGAVKPLAGKGSAGKQAQAPKQLAQAAKGQGKAKGGAAQQLALQGKKKGGRVPIQFNAPSAPQRQQQARKLLAQGGGQRKGGKGGLNVGKRAPVNIAPPAGATGKKRRRRGKGGSADSGPQPMVIPMQGAGVFKRRAGGGQRAPVFAPGPGGPPRGPAPYSMPPSAQWQGPGGRGGGGWGGAPPMQPQGRQFGPPGMGGPRPRGIAQAPGHAMLRRQEQEMAMKALKLQELEDRLRQAERREFIFKQNQVMNGNAKYMAGGPRQPDAQCDDYAPEPVQPAPRFQRSAPAFGGMSGPAPGQLNSGGQGPWGPAPGARAPERGSGYRW